MIRQTKKIRYKSAHDIAMIREAGRLVGDFHYELKGQLCAGMSTMDVERLAQQFSDRHKVVGVFSKVPGYSHCTCTCINNEVVHGIPNENRIIQNGDLLKVDFGVLKDGYIGDSAVTFAVGNVSNRAEKLMTVTYDALFKGINAAVVGARLGDIGYAIQAHVESHGFSTVRQFVGHGVGFELHEPPEVFHFGEPNTGIVLKEGLVIAIEPMINEGVYDCDILDDGWTAVTADGKLSAQFEHTIAVTKDGPEILTLNSHV
jgi:methionyl aminopeptidase